MYVIASVSWVDWLRLHEEQRGVQGDQSPRAIRRATHLDRLRPWGSGGGAGCVMWRRTRTSRALLVISRRRLPATWTSAADPAGATTACASSPADSTAIRVSINRLRWARS